MKFNQSCRPQKTESFFLLCFLRDVRTTGLPSSKDHHRQSNKHDDDDKASKHTVRSILVGIEGCML